MKTWICFLLMLCLPRTDAQGIIGVLGNRGILPKKGVPPRAASPHQRVVSSSLINRQTKGTALKPATGCPKGYSVYGDACFYRSQLVKTWASALSTCRDTNVKADLASINSNAEYDFIRRTFGSGTADQAWIGLHKDGPGVPYVWTNGDQVQYLPWGPLYTGQESTGYVAVNLKNTEFLPKTTPETTLPFLCKTRRNLGAGVAVGTRQALMNDRGDEKFNPVSASRNHRGSAAAYTCEDGWQGFEDKCYKAFSDPSTFAGASEKCRGRGAQLLSLHSPAESAFVQDKVVKGRTDEQYWIGLSRQENGLQWSDGSPLDYTNWAPQSILAPERILTPEKETLPSKKNEYVKQLEKCFKMKPKDPIWKPAPCPIKLFYVCGSNGAAEPVTQLMTTTTTTSSTTPATTTDLTTLYPWPELIIMNNGAPPDPGHNMAKLPAYMMNGALVGAGLKSAAANASAVLDSLTHSGVDDPPRPYALNVSGDDSIRPPRFMVSSANNVLQSNKTDGRQQSGEDDSMVLQSPFVILGVLVAFVVLLISAFGVLSWRYQFGKFQFPWRQRPNQDDHCLLNVRQGSGGFGGVDRSDVNQPDRYGALY